MPTTTALYPTHVLMLLLLCIALNARIAVGYTSVDVYDNLFRLPYHFMPVVYDLKLSLSSTKSKICGQIRIEMQCMERTSQILLHANPLFVKVQHATIRNRLSNETWDIGMPYVDWSRYLAIFNSSAYFDRGKVYYMSVWFTTTYADSHGGLIKYEDKERGWWASTLFEPTNARRVFPCFDEPRWRSIFKLQLWLEDDIASKKYVALSNTAGTRKRWNDRLTIWNFEPTPPLPTYLLTIAIGQFRSICSNENFTSEICIWRFSAVEDWNETALVIIQTMAEFQMSMCEYLRSGTGARLHLLIVPIAINGMENFGLINVKESLWPSNNFEEAGTGWSSFMSTLMHELTHQWFGNLVTMEWWDDIWLSESITCFISNPILEASRMDIVGDITTSALVNGSWSSGVVPSIVYRKGAAIVGLLNSVLGPGTMRHILRQYISNNQWKAANTSTFLSIVDKQQHEALPFSASAFFASWLYQGSHPIVFIDFDRTTSQFCLTQTPKAGSMTARWYIPIWVECLAGSTNETLHWILPHQQLILSLDEITDQNTTDAVAFNRNKPVYYQVTYRY